MLFFHAWALFFTKTLTLLLLMLIFLSLFLMLIARAKMKARTGELQLKSLNKQFNEQRQKLWQETLSKKELKGKIKLCKRKSKENKPEQLRQGRIFVISFKGDLQAESAKNLAEEITAILQIAEAKDEVLARLESPGGAVHGYGYAASQLKRIRDRHIKLTVAVDKVAASGGYLMACVADEIIAAPFALIGSIGVVAQIPNFHRWLDKKGIDFEQIYAGTYKRTLTMFGKNTTAGREKLKEQLEEIHTIFKRFIEEHRACVDVKKVATGEFWLAADALKLNLVDRLETSDDYLLDAFNAGRALFEVKFVEKKSLKTKLSRSMQALMQQFNLSNSIY